MKLPVCALLTIVTSSLWAASPVAGDWIGTIHAGAAELRVVLHVKDSDGKLTATLDSIDQGAKGIPIDSISFAGNKLTFDSNTINGHYSGKYDSTKPAIGGTWTQNGNDLPLDFEPYVEKPKTARTGPAAKPSDIDGTWEGKIDAGGQTLRVVFHITTGEDGELTATTDSPDQNAFGMPVTSVKRDGKTLRIEIKAVGATYQGTISEAKTKIDGTLSQGGGEMPLVLELKPAEKAK
jgi:hypothetical protein